MGRLQLWKVYCLKLGLTSKKPRKAKNFDSSNILQGSVQILFFFFFVIGILNLFLWPYGIQSLFLPQSPCSILDGILYDLTVFLLTLLASVTSEAMEVNLISDSRCKVKSSLKMYVTSLASVTSEAIEVELTSE